MRGEEDEECVMGVPMVARNIAGEGWGFGEGVSDGWVSMNAIRGCD